MYIYIRIDIEDRPAMFLIVNVIDPRKKDAKNHLQSAWKNKKSCLASIIVHHCTRVLSKVPDNFRATLPPSSTNQSRT